jgi:hypothetical protein
VNGFANRMLFNMCKRSGELPFGGGNILYGDIASRLQTAAHRARNVEELTMSVSFKEVWRKEYKRLSKERPGMLGAIMGRAAPHVLRLSMIYALLEKMSRVHDVHLKAALEIWRRCEDSARYIFGISLGDATADPILAALDLRDMSRTDIHNLFGRNKDSNDIDRALRYIAREGLAESYFVEGQRRSIEMWRKIRNS